MAGKPRRAQRKRALDRLPKITAATSPRAVPATVEARVHYIACRMSADTYRQFETRLELAEAWSVSESTIKNYTSEASRLVRWPQEDIEILRALKRITYGRIARRAEHLKSKTTGLPDWRSALEAHQLEAKYAGLDIDAKASEAVTAQPTIVISYADDPPPKGDPPPKDGAA